MRHEGFPILLAAKIANVTPKTLHNWDARGFLTPSVADAPARGVSRIYSFRDLVAIRVVCELRDAGISLQALRRVVKFLSGRKGLTASEALASATLVTDGRDVYVEQGEVTISELRRPGQRVL